LMPVRFWNWRLVTLAAMDRGDICHVGGVFEINDVKL
jgi:hypothetical protein